MVMVAISGTLRRRLVAVVAVAVIVAVGCGGDDDDPAGGGGDDSAQESTVASSSTTPTTTVAPPPDAVSVQGLHISAVVFGVGVELTNTTDAEISLDGLWLCNRPAYAPLAGVVGPGETTTVGADALGGLVIDGGEAALYSGDAFDDSTAMLDYVQWGAGGGRESVAVEAGYWVEGASVKPVEDRIDLFGISGDPESWG